MASKEDIEEFIGDKIELQPGQLTELKQLVGYDQDLREAAMEVMVQPDRVSRYEEFSRIDDYDPMNNNPYDVVAVLGAGSDNAIEYCLQGIRDSRCFARWSAMRALPKITPPRKNEYVASQIAEFLRNEYKTQEDVHSPDLYRAVDALLQMGKPGFTYLEMCASARTAFSGDVRRLIEHEVPHLDLERRTAATKYFEL